MVFVSNPFEPVTLFIKCVHALYLSGQLKLFYIYPVNMVNSKKEYPDKMVRNHFEHLQDGPKGKVQDVLCKMPLAAKVFNRTRRLILGSLKNESLQI